MSSTEEIAIEAMIAMLERKDFKRHLIAEINAEIDIPMIGERSEKRVFDAIYKVFLKALRGLDP